MVLAVRAGILGATFAVALIPVPAASAEKTFQAETTAVAVHFTLTQQPASSIITASLFDDALGYASGSLDTGGTSEAVASPVFPGRLVVQGPQLLCSELFSCPAQPPPYPLIADASYPRRQHDRASGSGQPIGDAGVQVTPLPTSAEATESANDGSTSAAHVRLLPGTPVEVRVGATDASSKIERVADGLRVRVESTVTDVTVANLVHIQSLRSTDDVLLRPGQPAVNRPHVVVGAVDVAGNNATIDDRGIHVFGNDGPALDQQLQHAGIRLRTLDVHHEDTKTGARSDAAGLRIDVALPVSGVPYVPNPLPPLPPPFDQVPTLPGIDANGKYVGQITLGAVGTAAGYGVQPTFDLGGVGPVPSPPAVGSGPVAPGHSGTVLAGKNFVARLGHGTEQAPPPAVAPPQTPALRSFIDGLSKRALELVYAVLALGTIGMFLGWRLATVLGRRA